MSNVFSHGGSAGDLIYHLAAVKDMGGGEFYINRNAHPHWRMNNKIIDSLLILIEAQPYITKCGIVDEPVGIDLDNVRRNWKMGLNLSDMAAAWLNIPHTSRTAPWLFVQKKRRVAPVVIHRSPRYQVENFPWRKVLDLYGKDAVFCGLMFEYRDFVDQYGPVSYWRTDNYLELAEIIAGADLFCGNQSSPAAVAQGLRQNMLQETVPRHSWAWNCDWRRPGMLHLSDGDQDVPTLEEWRVRDRTLLTSDKLAVIEASVKETAGLGGHMAEVGCYRGGSARLISTTDPARKLHAFDTFEGLPNDDNDAAGHRKGEFAADFDDVARYLADCNVEIHKGYFPATARMLEFLKFSFVHLDADLYETTKDALAFFTPRMVPGGIVVLDDWKWRNCPGVERAVTEAGLAEKVEETAPGQGRISF